MGEPVQDRGAYLEFGDLAFKIARHNSLPQKFETAHLGFDQASPVVAAPLLPERTPQVTGCAQNVVAHLDAGALSFPRLAVFPGRNDGVRFL